MSSIRSTSPAPCIPFADLWSDAAKQQLSEHAENVAAARAHDSRPSASRTALPAEGLGPIMDVLAQGGYDLVPGLLGRDIKFELVAGTRSFYDPDTKAFVLGDQSSPAEHAQVIVFETRRMQIDQRMQEINVRLGERAFQKADYRTGHRADEALRHKYEPQSRQEYVMEKAAAVAEAATDTIEFSRTARARGALMKSSPLESTYAAAYDRAYTTRFASAIARTGRVVAADNEAIAAGRQAARAAVADAVSSGNLSTNRTGEQYTAAFGREWDTKQAIKAARAAETGRINQGARVEAARRMQIDAGRQALADLVNAVDPISPQADQVIELVASFSALYGDTQLQLLLQEAPKGMDRLLRPYGFNHAENVGSATMERERAHYALTNFAALSSEQRAQLRRNPGLAPRFGISHTLTQDEMQARQNQKVNRNLPDGTNFQGTRVEFQEASLRNVVNHALGQIQQIRNAGPLSLLGRIVDGERGAALGALFDGALPAAAARPRRSSGTDFRTPLEPDVRRAPAPATSAHAVRPDPVVPAKGDGPATVRSGMAAPQGAVVGSQTRGVAPGKEGMSRALGLDPANVRVVANATDGMGANFDVVLDTSRSPIERGARNPFDPAAMAAARRVEAQHQSPVMDALTATRVQGDTPRKGTYWRQGSPEFQTAAANRKFVVMPESDARNLGFRPADTPGRTNAIEPYVLNGRQVESSGAGRETHHPISARVTPKPTPERAQAAFDKTIGADMRQAHGYKWLLNAGELGLLRPGNVSTRGVDAITVSFADGKVRIMLNDFTGLQAAKGPKEAHARWRSELDVVTSATRMKFGDPAVEKAIRLALKNGEIYVRTVRVDLSPHTGGHVKPEEPRKLD